MNFYPIKFYPIFKERIWGGNALKSQLNKDIPEGNIGESWEISSVEGDYSIISNGFLMGKNLIEVIENYPNEILGQKSVSQYGIQFPLLFKFLDAREDLSIQVHPNDQLAQERHNSFGKTEMWYVVAADQNARLVVGFNKNTNQQEYSDHLNRKTLVEILNQEKVSAGDVYFLETGTIHAIGAGCLIAEIQQTSDITYRLYDWDRVDAQGFSRELHTELALDAINYNTTETKKIYEARENKSVNMVSCDYFRTNMLQINGIYQWKYAEDSFTVFMCVNGNGHIKSNGIETEINLGETVLIPAAIKEMNIKGKISLLEVTI